MKVILNTVRINNMIDNTDSRCWYMIFNIVLITLEPG